MQKRPIDFFFNPASVAVVGASESPGKISRVIMDSLRETGFGGKVYPVNPKYMEVGGLRSYPSVGDIGEKVDIAIFAIPAEAMPKAFREAAGKIKGAIIIGGGFGESGEKGRAIEGEVAGIAAKEGVRVIGPNCMGIYDSMTRLDTFFIPRDRIKRPPQGGLSIISQSGSFAVTAMDELAADGIGVARVISYGNKSDVDESDCLEFLAGDDATTAVAVYIESVEDGRRFVEAASRCAARKPVMAVKVGKGGAGVTAARSHTGAMTGRYEVYRAAFRKAGVIELDGYEDFLVGCKALGLGKQAKGNRVIIITDGGGMGVGLADACHAMGLEAPPLPEDVERDLKGVLPNYFAVANPLDLTGSATDEMYAEALDKTLLDGAYDMAIVAALWGPPALTDRLAGLIAEKAGLTDKPVIVCSPGGEYARKRLDLFRRGGLPVFDTPEAAVRAAVVLAKGALRRGR